MIETFRAFLQPLIGPEASNPTLGPVDIDYDALLPSSRHNIARSVKACTDAMRSVRDGLSGWGDKARGDRRAAGTGAGPGVAGEMKGGLAGEFEREVRLRAVTPTRQVMKSSVGREASHLCRLLKCAHNVLTNRKQLWFCSLHAIHHFSMLRTIAVHELVSIQRLAKPRKMNKAD